MFWGENEYPWSSPVGALSFSSRVVGRARVLAFVRRFLFKYYLNFMDRKEIHVCKIYQ